jgi:predicted ester cyclase
MRISIPTPLSLHWARRDTSAPTVRSKGRLNVSAEESTPEENKRTVRGAFEAMRSREAWLSEHDEFFSPDLAGHFAGMPTVTFDMHLQSGLATLDAFPDLERPIDDLVAEGDKVVARWRSIGTHLGSFQGIPPTGKPLMMSGITVFRVADGKVVEEWSESDVLGLLQQMGAIPAAGAA